ncbi:MAG: L,D-transpeptidase [Nitratireductor sp.]
MPGTSPLLAALAVVFLAPLSPALASMPLAGLSGDEKRSVAAPGLLLAQGGDVEIFYDRAGNRVIVDAYTGAVIATARPRRLPLRERTLPRRAGPSVNDPDALERYRRYRERQLGRPLEPLPGEAARDYRQPIPEDDDFIARRRLPAIDEDGDVARREPLPRDRLSDDPVTGSTPREDDGATARPRGPTGASEDVARLQVLLDRAGVSPGVIDGRMGSNVRKALDALAEMTGERLDPSDTALVEAALADTGGPAFSTYTITAADAAGPFVASIPADYGDKARMERLGYTSTIEMLAERFHMDENYLRALNPGAAFSRPGTRIKVADPGKPRTGAVTRIVADKGREQVRAYDAAGNLVAAYPATIGSTDTPSPSGTVKVERIAFDPEYTYNPKLNFKQGDNEKVLTIPPGPNGPVGTIWIALSKPTYGIHGTPEPARIGKTNSHGCVRLTNWDAHELAKMVTKGVWVSFSE